MPENNNIQNGTSPFSNDQNGQNTTPPQNPFVQQQIETQQPNNPQNIYIPSAAKMSALSGNLSIFKRYPGKSIYIASLILAILFTFVPWIGNLFSSPSYNYYFFIGRNIFVLLYLLSLFALIFIRFGFWNNINLFKPYLKIINFIETLLIGAIVMFILTVGIYGDVQFGLLLSLICVCISLFYITYIKAIKA